MDKQSSSRPLIDIKGVTRKYGSLTALDDVSLQVPTGSVFGLVGANGAGKTTMIKHVMGLLKPQSGQVRVFGLDPVADPVGVLSRVGYLSEVNELPDWMRVDELINYTRAFYPNWDDAYAESLRQSFELLPQKRIKQMSKGQRARLGLLSAIAHRPEVLVLDEPSSGLDPLVRRDILRAIIRTISEDGRTVLFSSHLLDEVERVADYVAIIESGQIVRCGALEALKAAFHSISLRFDTPQPDPPVVRGAVSWVGGGHHWSAIVEGDAHEFQYAATSGGAEVLDCSQPVLNEIFVALVGDRHSTLATGPKKLSGVAPS